MEYFGFINAALTALFRGIGNLLSSIGNGIGRFWETLVNGGTPRPLYIPEPNFDPVPIVQASGFKFFFLILGIMGFVLIIYLWLRQRAHMQEDYERMDKHFIKPTASHLHETRWSKVEKLFTSNNESDWRLGIIEADAMLEDLTLQLGYPGANLGERLKSADQRSFPMLQPAWQAHLLRNRIAHEGMNFHLPQHEAWRAFKIYENIFRGYGYTG